MNIYLSIAVSLLLASCANNASTKNNRENESSLPPISGHYFETIRKDSETLRKGMEIELAVAREREYRATQSSQAEGAK